MKENYISPDVEIEILALKDVILSSIVQQDETFAGGGVVINPDDELLMP